MKVVTRGAALQRDLEDTECHRHKSSTWNHDQILSRILDRPGIIRLTDDHSDLHLTCFPQTVNFFGLLQHQPVKTNFYFNQHVTLVFLKSSFTNEDVFFLLHLRIFRGGDIKKDADKYVEKARRQIVLEAAAVACANGVPWAEALSISEGAIMKASAKPKRLPRGQKRPRP